MAPIIKINHLYMQIKSQWRSVHILFHVLTIAVVSGCENVLNERDSAIFLTDPTSQVELNVLSVSTTRACDSWIIAITLFPIFCTKFILLPDLSFCRSLKLHRVKSPIKLSPVLPHDTTESYCLE